ncbi:ABC transporter ATP-binding protein [Pseudalkalibacillus decolorationis]|uniref:ABC transporter ATP-binding protein n=1 Tax=Pseudalkalibacillus decolorationis TaxID=163879 RepID=UPI0021490941|nr:dipeptide ABC transporter ATP-binding protein [Pseudalkalibacillus decolorationis]
MSPTQKTLIADVKNEQAAKPILEVSNLRMHFPIKAGVMQKTVGRVKAVDGVSFQVQPGETLGIVGESGCGKSTLGRAIIRLYQPTSGNVIFQGKDITRLKEGELRKNVRKQIQMVFQDPFASLNPRKTLENCIIEPLKTHGTPKIEQKERVRELLDTVGLDATFANRYPHEFSGGQRQRIGIARALALNPNLVIADEPVSALDVSIQAQIINLMEDLQQKYNLTYLFISHDLGVVRHISDRVGVMYLGNMMELAEKHDLYKEPLHPYTQALLSAVPAPRKKGKKKRERIILSGELPSPANPPNGCVFHTRCPAAIDVCSQQIPKLQEVHPKHYVACHLYE